MIDFKTARLLFANAAYGKAESGADCLLWALPAGKDGMHLEFRAILDGNECLCAEERRVNQEGASEWKSAYPTGDSFLPRLVTDCLQMLEAIGVEPSKLVGRGYNDKEEDDDIIYG